MTKETHTGERKRLDSLRDEVVSKIESVEAVFGSLPLLQPALAWLEELTNQLKEHEDLIQSDDDDAYLSSEDIEELSLWAEGFSDFLNEGEDIELDCIPADISEDVESTLEHLLAHFTAPIRQASWALYYASIGAD